RLQRARHPMGDDGRGVLVDLMTARAGEATSAARVRRLAVEALLLVGPSDRSVIESAARDPDAQVRRLAVRAAGAPRSNAALGDAGRAMVTKALDDESPIVRVEALHALAESVKPAERADTERTENVDPCARIVSAVGDRVTTVALAALDGLARCGESD